MPPTNSHNIPRPCVSCARQSSHGGPGWLRLVQRMRICRGLPYRGVLHWVWLCLSALLGLATSRRSLRQHCWSSHLLRQHCWSSHLLRHHGWNSRRLDVCRPSCDLPRLANFADPVRILGAVLPFTSGMLLRDLGARVPVGRAPHLGRQGSDRARRSRAASCTPHLFRNHGLLALLFALLWGRASASYLRPDRFQGQSGTTTGSQLACNSRHCKHMRPLSKANDEQPWPAEARSDDSSCTEQATGIL